MIRTVLVYFAFPHLLCACTGLSQEDFSLSEKNAINARLQVMPEYADPEAMLISSQVLERLEGLRFIDTLLEYGMPRILLLVPPVVERDTNMHAALERLQNHLAVSAYSERVQWIEAPNLEQSTHNLWVRDYAPHGYRTVDTIEWVVTQQRRDQENQLASPIASHLHGQMNESLIRRIQINLEGGNILIDEYGLCLVGENKIFDEEQASLEKILRQYFGCKRLITIPLPSIAPWASHLDMYVKLSGNRKILVSHIPERDAYHKIDSIQDHAYPRIETEKSRLRYKLKKAVSMMEHMSQNLARKAPSYQLINLPTSVGIYSKDFEQLDEKTKEFYTSKVYALQYGTHANSVLIRQQAVVLPVYLFTDSSTLDSVREAYREGGYAPEHMRALFADDLLFDHKAGVSGGAWHCVSMHLPMNPVSPSCAATDVSSRPTPP